MANQQIYKPENLLVLDIETVPQYQSFDELPEPWKDLLGRQNFQNHARNFFAH